MPVNAPARLTGTRAHAQPCPISEGERDAGQMRAVSGDAGGSQQGEDYGEDGYPFQAHLADQ